MDKVKQTLETFLREEDGQALTGRAGKIGLPLPLTLPKARGSAVVLQQDGVPGLLEPRKERLRAVLQGLQVSG